MFKKLKNRWNAFWEKEARELDGFIVEKIRENMFK